MSKDNLTELTASINQNLAMLLVELEKRKLPRPSFAQDGLQSWPLDMEVQVPRMALAEAAISLYHLAVGPSEFLKYHCINVNHEAMVVDVLNQFDVWNAVPLEGSATYVEIEAKTGLPANLARRFLRYAFTLHLFDETSPGSGQIVHTVTSAHVVKGKFMKEWIGHNLEEIGYAKKFMVESIKKNTNNNDDLGNAAWALGFYPDKPEYKTIFDHMAQDGEGENKGFRERRFGGAMAFITADPGFAVSNIHQGYDWDSLGDATICDVGGSTGHLSVELAAKHPKLKMIVQDFPGLKDQFDASCPAELKDRVSFQAHDFFKPEPVKNAHCLFKHIMHDWPDKTNIETIRNILPSMGPNSRIFVVDGIFPGPGALPYLGEKMMSGLDLQMMIAFNSLERSREDWAILFRKANPSLEIRSFK